MSSPGIFISGLRTRTNIFMITRHLNFWKINMKWHIRWASLGRKNNLNNPKTGLYYQSLVYIYDLLEQELEKTKQK